MFSWLEVNNFLLLKSDFILEGGGEAELIDDDDIDDDDDEDDCFRFEICWWRAYGGGGGKWEGGGGGGIVGGGGGVLSVRTDAIIVVNDGDNGDIKLLRILKSKSLSLSSNLTYLFKFKLDKSSLSDSLVDI